MPSLTDERYGPAAVDVLGELHPTNRIALLEKRLGAVERELAYALRVPRGLYINFPDDGSTAEDAIEWDRQQRIRFTSEDQSVTITNGTLEDPSQVDLSAGGCTVSYSEVIGDVGSCEAVDCGNSITIVGANCISTVVTCDAGNATVAVGYIGNHYKRIEGDTGSAEAVGCDDTLGIIGGICIATVAADGSPDTVTIDWTGSTWSSIATDDGTATPGSPGCANELALNGDGSCITTSVVGGAITIGFSGASYSTVNGNTGSATASGCGDDISIVGDAVYLCTTAAEAGTDTLTISLCFPVCATPVPGMGIWNPGTPAGWARLPLGTCGGACTTVAVPYWACSGG